MCAPPKGKTPHLLSERAESVSRGVSANDRVGGVKTGQSDFAAAQSINLICEEEQNEAKEGWGGGRWRSRRRWEEALVSGETSWS